MDTATSENFLSKENWSKVGEPTLEESTLQYQSASKQVLSVVGTFTARARMTNSEQSSNISFILTEIPNLILLGRDAIATLRISLDALLYSNTSKVPPFLPQEPNQQFQDACSRLCDDYAKLFKPELGCVQGFELDVEFKSPTRSVFRKPRSVPFAIPVNLPQAYDAAIEKGIWTPVRFNKWGTPFVPIRKTPANNFGASLRACGYYSATVNPQLKVYQHSLPIPEDLMRKLGGDYGFTKTDLADAYNQIKLAPKSKAFGIEHSSWGTTTECFTVWHLFSS